MYSKRVMYGKIGRGMDIDENRHGNVGGDNEAPEMLRELATRHPDVEWIVVSKNSGWTHDLPNVTNIWSEPALREVTRAAGRSLPNDAGPLLHVYDEMVMPLFDDSIDGILMWLGQHGSVGGPIPAISGPAKGSLASPLMSLVVYVSYIVRGINYWKREERFRTREEIWLNPDTRNYLKMRDLKWPCRHPVLGQYNESRQHRVYRYGDRRTPSDTGFSDIVKPDALYPDVWTYSSHTVYAALELGGVPMTSLSDLPSFDDRDLDLGVIMNENRPPSRYEHGRLHFLQDWVMPSDRFEYVHGTWSDKATKVLGFTPQPLDFKTMMEKQARTKTTLTTMASGSRYATAKPWEAFSQGVVCFFAPGYDDQGHIIPTAEQIAQDAVHDHFTASDKDLATWLRCASPEQFRARVDAVSTSRETYEWLVTAQHDLFTRRKSEGRIYTMIQERLGLS